MKKLLLMAPLLLLAQTRRPPVEFKGVEAKTFIHSGSSGENAFLETEHGFIGPFLKLPPLPTGVGYVSTEVNVPRWPAQPCGRGNWAKTNEHLYMCISAPVEKRASGTVWRRLAWDTAWNATPAPQP